MAKIKTINVVENIGGVMGTIHAFTDDEQGKEEAEAMFTRIVREALCDEFDEQDHHIIDGTIDTCLMYGIYERDGYEVIITWSA